MIDLRGKVALVTGASRGIGRACALRLAQSGADVVLNYLNSAGEARQLAEEVLQDVMMAVWRSAANFRGESKVRTWMISIARNQAISIRRKHRIEQVELEDIYANDGTGPLERIVLEDQIEMLRAGIRQLPQAQRETLELVFFHQMSGAEVAAVLGISEGTVKSRLHRAKETLRGLLGSEVSLA